MSAAGLAWALGEERRSRLVTGVCFSGHHEWLLSEQVDLLPFLLLPLAGPEEFPEDEMESGCLLRSGGRGTETLGGCPALCPSLTPPLLNHPVLPPDLQYLPAEKQREPEADIRKMLLETLLLVGGQVRCGEGTWGLLCAQETAK